MLVSNSGVPFRRELISLPHVSLSFAFPFCSSLGTFRRSLSLLLFTIERADDLESQWAMRVSRLGSEAPRRWPKEREVVPKADPGRGPVRGTPTAWSRTWGADGARRIAVQPRRPWTRFLLFSCLPRTSLHLQCFLMKRTESVLRGRVRRT